MEREVCAFTIKPCIVFTDLRTVIEEQYAKKLAGLAKMAVGRDEVG